MKFMIFCWCLMAPLDLLYAGSNPDEHEIRIERPTAQALLDGINDDSIKLIGGRAIHFPNLGRFTVVQTPKVSPEDAILRMASELDYTMLDTKEGLSLKLYKKSCVNKKHLSYENKILTIIELGDGYLFNTQSFYKDDDGQIKWAFDAQYQMRLEPLAEDW